MFIQSLIHGLASLKNPYVILLVVLWILLNLAYLIGLRLATNLRGSETAAAPGCLTQILGILVQGFLMGLFILLLLPILLGLNTQITFDQVESFALLASRAGIVAVLLMSLLSFIPGFGRFMAGIPGLEAFLAGVIVFRLIAPPFTLHPHYPNFWETCGYLALALVLSKLLFLGIQVLQSRLPSHSPWKDYLQTLIGPSLDILGGILPLLMYIYYVRLSLLPGVAL